MERFVRVTLEFDAHHVVAEDRPRCSRSHGHRWTVDITKAGREGGLEADARGVVEEFADRSLNDMVGFSPTPEAMSAHVMEVLLLRHPTLTLVSVSDGRLAGITKNEPPR